MKDLFSAANFVWLIPLCLFALLVIVLTAYALRKEICSVLDGILFPKGKRYVLPAQIISKLMPKEKSAAPPPAQPAQPKPEEQPKPKPEPTKTMKAAIPPPPKETVPAAMETNLKRAKPPKSIFKELGSVIKWNFRKMKRVCRAKDNAPRKTFVVPDRIVFTLLILILFACVIFLGVKVKMLSAMIKRQQVTITDLKRGIRANKEHQRHSIVYVLPGMPQQANQKTRVRRK